MATVQHGLRWHKLDLHVHTPASKDYSGPAITPREFVEAVIKKGIAAIGVTDHNSGAWIDVLKEAAKGTSLVVFPGVEVSVTGGKSGVHIIAVFDCDATAKSIENLLANLGFDATQYGDLEAVSPLGPDAVVERINAAGALAVLAHADSSKGVLSDMYGMQRINVMNSTALHAVEVTNAEKTAPLCSGHDANYKRKLAYYRASDNRAPGGAEGHSVEGVGTRYSWFKTDGLTLDALRQAFADPDVRIRCDSQSPASPDEMYPRIVSLEVSQGFFEGMKFQFHEGLNSIIGGKGVGKSLLVELLRFVLGQPSVIEEVIDDMDSKLEAQLGHGGVVDAVVQLEPGQSIRISRTFDGQANPTVARFLPSGKLLHGDIVGLFPVLAYSQTETLEIARDPRAQLSLIDSLLDLTTIESKIELLERKLDVSDQAIEHAVKASEGVAPAKKLLATHDEKLASLTRALKSKELDALEVLVPRSSYHEELAEVFGNVETLVDDFVGALKECEIPALPEELEREPSMVKLARGFENDAAALMKNAKGILAKARDAQRRARSAADEWDRVVQRQRKEYEAFVKKEGGDRPSLVAQKEMLERQRPGIVKQLSALNKQAEALASLESQRAQLLQELADAEASRHEMRRTRYAELSAASKGRLELSLVRFGDRGRYVEVLKSLKAGSRVQDASIELLCNSVTPRQLLDYVATEDAGGLAKAASIAISTAQNLVRHLSALSDVRGLRGLEHRQLLADRPSIKFRKDDGKYYELASLSVGQKCTALLVIALADGTRPVIVDQPEDALDITSVFEDVTLQLRGRKQSRQFILTTHNPTVAVASDTDQFHVLTATATKASLSTDGAIDRPVVRTAVIQHLEGGAESFALKSRKYGLWLE